jgi:GrpB-like predicted nucleotidyltransferase (UPF0157 family)
VAGSNPPSGQDRAATDHEPQQPAPIVVVPYDPDWPRQFEEVAAELREALSGLLVGVEHMGSTSIPGLAAKPTIDVMGFVPDFEAGFGAVEPLVARGLESMGEFGIPGRHFFTRTRNGLRALNLHIFAAREGPGGDRLRHELVFRDFLRAHRDVAAEYGALKIQLATRFRDERAATTDAKTEFITSVVARARAIEAQPDAQG